MEPVYACELAPDFSLKEYLQDLKDEGIEVSPSLNGSFACKSGNLLSRIEILEKQNADLACQHAVISGRNDSPEGQFISWVMLVALSLHNGNGFWLSEQAYSWKAIKAQGIPCERHTFLGRQGTLLSPSAFDQLVET